MSIFEKCVHKCFLIFNNIFIIYCILLNTVFEIAQLNIFNEKKKKFWKRKMLFFTQRIFGTSLYFTKIL